MPKILRKNQKVFASTAGGTQVSKFGSLAAGAPAFTSDPDLIQSLSNYLSGWFGAVVGSNSPAIEDMNAICYLFAYQLAYGFQAGVAEWNSLTTYYIGSFASDGLGNLYYSTTDNNLNNVLTSTANWRLFGNSGAVVTNAGAYQILAGDGIVRSSGTFAKTMPNATLVSGNEYVVKKIDTFGTTTTIAFLGGQNADGQTTLTLTEQYSFYRLKSNGTNYDLVGWG